MKPFAYIGFALTLPQFQGYVKTYDFGSVPPDFIVLHHTANPDASWAPLSSDPRTKWDRDEAGVVDVRSKRVRQLNGVMAYYRDTLGWTAGPHLFIDDRWIYLFTPMNTVGIHAKWGNAFRQAGKLHYSIGIEVIGYYGKVAWPAPVAANVAGAIQALAGKLPLELHYLYPTPESKPGMVGTGEHQACAHLERLRFGGVSSHRDYNKPECPGAAITEAFYMQVIAPPPVFPQLYRTNKPTAISQASDGRGALAGVAPAGMLLLIDVPYPQQTGHISKTSPNFADLGFVDLADLDAVV